MMMIINKQITKKKNRNLKLYTPLKIIISTNDFIAADVISFTFGGKFETSSLTGL